MTTFSMPHAARSTDHDCATDESALEGRRALVVCDQWLGSDGYAGMKSLAAPDGTCTWFPSGNTYRCAGARAR